MTLGIGQGLSPAAVNPLPPGYIDGAAMVSVSTTVFTIGTAGAISRCKDSTDAVEILWTGALAADITAAGAGGLDTGVVAVGTPYAIYAISDVTGVLPTAAMWSASFVAPTLPAGYTHFRRLWGAMTAAGAPLLLTGIQNGTGRTRWWEVASGFATAALAAGAANVYTPVSLAAFMPPSSQRVKVFATLVSPAGINIVFLKPSGFPASVIGNAGLAPGAATGAAPFGGHLQTLIVATDAAQSIDYIVVIAGGALTLFVAGWEDTA